MPDADVLYACDAKWWEISGPNKAEFPGERYSTHSDCPRHNNKKTHIKDQFGLRLVDGVDEAGFCFDIGTLHFGGLSGFQAINLALQFGATTVYLLGFDMDVGAKVHFFGDHPKGLTNSCNYGAHIGRFDTASRMLPDGIQILNATPDSALQCFERVLI